MIQKLDGSLNHMIASIKRREEIEKRSEALGIGVENGFKTETENLKREVERVVKIVNSIDKRYDELVLVSNY